MSGSDRIREIDRQISLLNRERRQIRLDEIETFQNEHRRNIGRCFRISGGRCAIVTGVPEVKRNANFDISFNQYQFPALILECLSDEEAVIPFDSDTIYSRNGTDFGGEPISGKLNYQEISFEEFCDEFEKRIDALRTVISAAAKQEEA